jgi:hypothetical protein
MAIDPRLSGSIDGMSMPDRVPQWLFGYASLVNQPRRRLTREISQDGFVADLRGYRRIWKVAMDNRIDIPGYKYYVDPASGARPPVHVAFLDIEPDDQYAVNGVCIPVRSDQVGAIDRREQQYTRIDVGERFPMLDGPVWVYIGSAEGRARRGSGDRRGSTVVTAEYLDSVLRGFGELGDAERLAFISSTTPCGCPVVDLRRRPIPAAPGHTTATSS